MAESDAGPERLEEKRERGWVELLWLKETERGREEVQKRRWPSKL